MLATTTAGILGITGAQFLWGYGTLCAIGATAVWQERRRVLGPAATSRDPQPELGAYRLALMSGGPDRAITAAAAQLFRDGRLEGTSGALTASGELPPTADPLERAVFDAVRAEPGLSVEAMNGRVRDDASIAAMTEQMTRSGLLLEAPEARRMRLLWVVPAVLAAIGLAGILTGAGSGAGAVPVVAVLVTVAVLMTVRLAGNRPLATNHGRRLLERQRREKAPRRLRPVAGEIGLMTALYGGGALWLTDPVTASALRVPRENEHRGGDGGGWGGDGGWGGSDGGGGCGGSGGGGGGCGGGGN
jgi:uncharacterized protein (TIGR04222 family)